MLDSRQLLHKSQRVVIKAGTNILFENEGLSQGRIKALARQIADLRRLREVVLVSSGAIGSGFKKLGLTERPKSLRMKQACAAVGQVSLMAAWAKALAAEGLTAAQILLSADDLADRARFLNAKNTLLTLFEHDVVPVINENDTVAVEELKVGDNDTLGALVAGLVEADLFINLTDIDGLYEADPRARPDAALISQVEAITPRILSLAGGGGPLGVGGMYTKVRAAKRLAELGTASVIANGARRDALKKIIEGQDIGTFFKPPAARAMAGKKSWLAFASRPKGRLTVDAGCAAALTKRGKSLLPGGITKTEGAFAAGDAVKVLDESGGLLAVGLVNYNAAEVEKIMGRPSGNISAALGYCHSDEVVHRDNLVLSAGLI
ncbi:MAG: glutamate 5-kinase [Candidatus Adiutrix sp.]|jgi:glutamate 5-kinase|nr:glutamate 5-kinase [Candidatus Adiutrix sp.]